MRGASHGSGYLDPDRLIRHTPKSRRTGLRFRRFSPKEIRDLFKAWAVLSAAFAILFTGTNILSFVFLVSFIISAITVGTGFLLHELGHKFVAQKYGLWAEFRSYDQGLMLALVMSFFGFIFAAPGAVMIQGHTSIPRIGKISIAGPAINYVLAVLFIIGGLLNPISVLNILFLYGAQINAFLGLFNMIPFAMFDGKKIITWHKGWYGLMVVLGFMLVFGSFMI